MTPNSKQTDEVNVEPVDTQVVAVKKNETQLLKDVSDRQQWLAVLYMKSLANRMFVNRKLKT